MRRLWAAAALAPLVFAASMAHADTSVSTGTTAPLATSSAGNVTITSAGSIAPTTNAAPAVTIDSTNGAGTTVSNAGAITFTGVSGATGIQANSGFTGLITNTGTITLTETTTGVTSNQGFNTGPFANGANRYGIHVMPGTFTGIVDAGNNNAVTAIDNTGTITVVGENSAGILVDANLVGDILQAGTITVTGGSTSSEPSSVGTLAVNPGDVSYGVHTTGTITGDVNIAGAISVTGQNAIGVALDKGVTGALLIGNSVVATGYRDTANPGLTATPLLNADQTLQGGPAVYVGGSVTQGISIEVAAAAGTAPVTPAITGGSIVSYGQAPAMLIGGSGPLTIGQIGATGVDLLVGGAISAQGIYNNINATGLQIGGANSLPISIGGVAAGSNFGAVTFADGINVTGSIGATTASTTAGLGNATSLEFGSGAIVPSLTVTNGTIAATSQAAAGGSGPLGTNSVAVKIDAGGSLTSLSNGGLISASITPIIVLQGNVGVYTGGTSGTPTAVMDNSGNLTSVTNTYNITSAYLDSSGNIAARGTALNLSANTAGVTVTQSAFTGTLPTGVTVITPSITGDIIFGSGAATLNVQTGTVTGNITYGANAGNAITISGGATVTGDLAQAAGGMLAVNVSNGALNLNAPTSQTIGGTTQSIGLSSLQVGSTGQLTFTVNPTDAGAATTPQFSVAGATSLANGAKINLDLASKVTGTATYTLIQNIGGSTFSSSGLNTNFVGGVPFIYTPTLNTTQGVNGSLSITLAAKTAAEFTGFSDAEKAEYAQFFTAFSNDPAILSDVLSKTDQVSFKQTYDQFLPDFAGGPYQTMEVGQEAIYRAESDTPLKLQSDQTRGWVQEIGYLDHRDNKDSGGYNGSGFGVVGGVESAQGDGAIGLSAAFLTTKIKDAAQSANGHLTASVLEAGAYWRSGGTGLNFNASLNGGWAFFNSQRMVIDASSPDPVTGSTTPLVKSAESNWNGGLIAGHLGVSAPITAGRFYIRPEGSLDYFALYEGAHAERGGGTGFDLTVASRTSQETIAQADVVMGATFGDSMKYRPELTLGWRDVVEGGPAKTTANFQGGQTFTLTPNFQDKGGFLARLGIRAGGAFADFSADAGGVFRNGYETYDARAMARFLF